MFEIGELVWYRNFGHADPAVPAIITSCHVRRDYVAYTCRREDANFDSWGDQHQFESRACHLCGAATDAPGCPLCLACAEEQAEREQDARDEAEQRRRPR